MTTGPKSSRPVRVILDSNAFFVPAQFRIDIFEELKRVLDSNFEPILLFQIHQELEKLAARNSSKMHKKASYALKLAERCKQIRVDEPALSPDDTIVEMAREWKCPVFTNDRQLKKRLRNINVPVIYLRQKSHLEMDGRL